MNKTEVLEQGMHLIVGDREKNYGSTEINFSRIAGLRSVVLGCAVDSHQVALCLAQLKVARLIETPTHEDSWIDLAGYVGIGGELATGGERLADPEKALLRDAGEADAPSGRREAPRGTFSSLEGLRVGTVVDDRDGDRWELAGEGWMLDAPHPSEWVSNWGPFTLISGGSE